MTQEQNDRLYNALDSLYQTKEFRELKELVMELSQKEECVKGDYNNIYPSIERHIDFMAETAGWIYDTLNGGGQIITGKHMWKRIVHCNNNVKLLGKSI